MAVVTAVCQVWWLRRTRVNRLAAEIQGIAAPAIAAGYKLVETPKPCSRGILVLGIVVAVLALMLLLSSAKLVRFPEGSSHHCSGCIVMEQTP